MEKLFKSRLFIVLNVLLIIVFASSLLFTGCVKEAVSQPVINVGLLLGSGGLGDKSFNDSAYDGLLNAQKKYNIRFDLINRSSPDSDLEAVRQLARNNYDLIIGIAYENKDTIAAAANEFPAIKFGAVDFEVPGPNISSIVYREQEGDFLIGVLAAMLTKTKYVGVIGGTDIPAIRRIMSGFQQGVAYQDNTVKVFTDFTGSFSDQDAGYKMAMNYYDAGADVIHNAASKSGLGIIEAAKETGKLTTGTSGDQRYMAPGIVVGNRPKRVDTAVMMLIEDVINGTFTSGTRSLGLKENGIGLGPFDETIVTPAMSSRLNDLEQQIIEGSITVQQAE